MNALYFVLGFCAGVLVMIATVFLLTRTLPPEDDVREEEEPEEVKERSVKIIDYMTPREKFEAAEKIDDLLA